MKLADLQLLKDFAMITNTSYDGVLDQLLTSYTKRFEQITNREFLLTSRTKKFNAGKRYFYLPAFPISASPAPVVTLRSTTMSATVDYFIHEEDGLIEWDYIPTWTDPLEVVITWTGGFGILIADTVTTNVDVVENAPDDLINALLIQCAYAFQRRQNMGGSTIAMPSGTVGYQEPFKLLPDVLQTLLTYRASPQRT